MHQRRLQIGLIISFLSAPEAFSNWNWTALDADIIICLFICINPMMLDVTCVFFSPEKGRDERKLFPICT